MASLLLLRRVTAFGYFSYMYSYSYLYLRGEGAIFMTSHMSLPIHTTTAGEFLKSLALYNNLCKNTFGVKKCGQVK